MTILEAYKKSYEAENKALRESLAQKRKKLKIEGQSAARKAERQMRLSYAEAKRREAFAPAADMQDGAAENARRGVLTEHKAAQETRKKNLEAELEGLRLEAESAEAQTEKAIADNARAYALKEEQAKIKEAAAAQKAAKKSSGSSKKTGSSGSLSRAQIISLMRGGVYDASFAGKLGISDEAVRLFIKNKGKSTEAKKETEDKRLPGTYKPPLK